jgi:SAM-dependent methyltransferase
MSKSRDYDEPYDEFFAENDINSDERHQSAKKEVDFLIKHLKLVEGEKILDVPCGTGRHALRFVERGFKVTGVDLSKTCIKIAKENCKGAGVKLFQGDMLNLKKFHKQFDVVLNLYNSFGYFKEHSKNEHVLKELISTLKPNGKIAIEFLNRDWFLRENELVSTASYPTTFTLEANQYDPKLKTCDTHFIAVDKETRQAKVYYYTARLYSKADMLRLMKKFGLKRIKVFGNYDGEAFNRFSSGFPIIVGQT